MSRLIYMPLEAYEERYTVQLSSENGWFMTAARKNGIKPIRIVGKAITDEVGIGDVFDAKGRMIWCMTQLEQLLQLGLRDGDVIYFEDFWTPGIEAIALYCWQAGINVKMYAQYHAGIADPHDYLQPVKKWAIHWERCLGQLLTGVFVANTCLQEMLHAQKIVHRDKALITGLPFSSEEVRERTFARAKTQTITPWKERRDNVLFTSRWDDCKQPWFFIGVAEKYAEMYPKDSVYFIATTSRPAGSAGWKQMREQCAGTHVQALRVTKDEYYNYLFNSKIQFNCALQDFVSNALMESAALGCCPVYPDYLSFPESMDPIRKGGKVKPFLYKPWNMVEAAELIHKVIHAQKVFDPYPIAQFHDGVLPQRFRIMGFSTPQDIANHMVDQQNFNRRRNG